MKKLFYFLILAFLFNSCSKSSTEPAEKQKIFIEIYQNEIFQEVYDITEDDNEDLNSIFFNNEQIGVIKTYTNIPYYENFNDEPIGQYVTLAKKFGFYSIFEHTNVFDTLRIDYQLDFHPVNTYMNCGTIFDINSGIYINKSCYVWRDSTLITSFFTNDLGRFAIDIISDDYSLKTLDNKYLIKEFYLKDGYGDYEIFLELEN